MRTFAVFKIVYYYFFSFFGLIIVFNFLRFLKILLFFVTIMCNGLQNLIVSYITHCFLQFSIISLVPKIRDLKIAVSKYRYV